MNPEYTIDDIFDKSSPYFNGALRLTRPPSASTSTTGDPQSSENLSNKGLDLPSITVDPTGSIQDALDKLAELGGGIINLLAGTYVISALTGDSSIEIRGVSPSATILDANSTTANLTFAGTAVYTTGTITSITGGVNVTGSGTLWLANASAGQHLFLGTRWYQIAAVTGNTTLILAEGYGDNVTMPGAAYRIATVKQNITIKNLTIKNSTGTGLVLTDCRKIILDNLLLLSNNKGAVLTNVSECNADRTAVVTSTSNGIELTNSGLNDWESVNCISNGGSGFVLNNVKTMTLLPCSATANTADGFNITTGVDLTMVVEASGNSGQGIEMVATCLDISIQGIVKSNTSDGIKLTATSSQIKVNIGDIQSNGGYGVNIAFSTCDNNVITGNTFISNTSGQVNDLGSRTIIRGNIGVKDNATSALNNIQTYTPSVATTVNLDLSKGDVHHVTMPAGNVIIAAVDASVGQRFIVRILQDSVGSRTVTWFGTINWAGGSAPTLTTTASRADSLEFEKTAVGTYDGFVLGANLTNTQGTATVKVVVVAGGGGGGNLDGGGGAGGYKYNGAFGVTAQAYTVTIGAGGNGSASGGTYPAGTNGGNSVFSTITSTGGGYGATQNNAAAIGGSGGGGAGTGTTTGAAGTSGEGFAGGNATAAANYSGGGGGGAGAVGGNFVSTTVAGDGGVGVANPITGSVSGELNGGTYWLAGGGGGGIYGANTAGTHGKGGGGDGSAGNPGPTGGAATANTGGGGGGAGNTAAGGAGGSGIVIITFPVDGSSGVSTTSTGGTITTVGGNQIHTFTSNGTWTMVAI